MPFISRAPSLNTLKTNMKKKTHHPLLNPLLHLYSFLRQLHSGAVPYNPTETITKTTNDLAVYEKTMAIKAAALDTVHYVLLETPGIHFSTGCCVIFFVTCSKYLY